MNVAATCHSSLLTCHPDANETTIDFESAALPATGLPASHEHEFGKDHKSAHVFGGNIDDTEIRAADDENEEYPTEEELSILKK